MEWESQHGVLRLRICLVIVFVVAATIIPASSTAAIVPYVLPNVLGTNTNDVQGVYSAIETSDPTLRPDPSGEWVYHRAIARLPASNSYVEVGWLKDAGNGSCPRVYWVAHDVNGVDSRDFYTGCGALGMGVSYNYEVLLTSQLTWSLYWNDLGHPIKNVWLGWSTGTEWASGGEAPNINQGMGDSTHNNVQRRGTNGSWNCACGYQVYNPNLNIWTLNAGANSSSWRIFGNN